MKRCQRPASVRLRTTRGRVTSNKTIAPLAVTIFALGAASSYAQISVTPSATSYTTDFNSYNPNSASNLTATIGAGWTAASSGTATPSGRGTGTSATGGYWGYGTGSEFALGALRSGTPGDITYTVTFNNATGLTINALSMSWNYEQWRFANTSGWDATGVGGLSTNATLNGKDFTGSATGTNGTAATTAISSFSLTGLTIANATTFGSSWKTTDGTGADNGVAVDDYTMTVTGLALPTAATSITSMAFGSGVTITGFAGASNLTATIGTTENFAGVLQNSGTNAVGLIKNGSGTLTLSGANTYTGATTINAGTLTLSGGSALANTGAVSLANTAGAILNLSAAETIGSLAGGGTTGGNVTLGSSTLTVGDANTTSFDGAISGTGGVTKNGGGALMLSGVNTYSGTTTINAGTLSVGDGSAINDAGAVTLSTTTASTLNVAASETIGSLAGGSNTVGTVTLNANTLTLAATSGTTTFAGVINGTGGLIKNGAASFTLSGANTYSGVTVIQGGTLTVSGGSAISDSSAVTLANSAGTSLVLSSSERIKSLAGGGTTGGNVTLGSNTLTTGDATTSYGGVISGAGGVTKTGAGIFTLAGANSYSGTTAVNSGTLLLSGAGRINSTSALTLGGGNLEVDGAGAGGQAFSNLTLSLDSSIDLTDTSSLTFAAFNSGAYVDAALAVSNYNDVVSPDFALRFTGDLTANSAFNDFISHLTLNGDGAAISFDGTYTNIGVAAVPEPSTYLSLLGVVGLIGFRERRRFRKLWKPAAA